MAGPVRERVTDADRRHFDFVQTLHRISDELTEEQTAIIKLSCMHLIPKGRAEQLKRTVDVFYKLMELGKIDQENFKLLEDILERIGRQDLIRDVLWRFQPPDREIPERENAEDVPGVPTEILLRGPKMAMLYSQACRQGSLPVHSTRAQVVGQFRSGKTCLIKRLMGEEVIEEEVEPITDGINIIPDVQSKTWKKSKEEIDDLAGPLLRKPQDIAPSSEEAFKNDNMPETKEMQSSRPDLPTATPDEKPTDIDKMPKDASENTKPAIPDIVFEAANRMKKAGITEDELGTADHPRLSFWDFGGQATYYGTHQCFITPRGVYVLVMSLLQKLSDPVPDPDYKASVDNLRTGGDYLDHWLNSVRSHTQQHTGRPPVIIILTHKDKVSEEYIENYKQEIRSHIEGKAAGRLVMPEIFAVDNTTEDADVDKIRNYIRQVASKLPHMGEEIPISWLHLKSRLTKRREEGAPFLDFQEIAKISRDRDINITDRHTLAKVLTFFHDRGDVIFFDEPSLRDDVTIQPQVMIDAFRTIITVPEYQEGRQTDPEVRRMWERLEREGVLSDELLTKIWEEKDRQLEKPFLIRHRHFLKALMEKFYLICNATPISDASEEAQQEEIYFVPALLSCERDDAELYPSNMHKCPQTLYFVFSEKFLPSGMFCRLQALCVRRFGLVESRVFAGCARFPTDDGKQSFVVTKVGHYLKVELLSTANVFTEGLRVRKFLSSALFEIKEKWIPCIQYDLCCSTQDDGGEPSFQALLTVSGSVEQHSGIPSEFRTVWMTSSSQIHRTETSGEDGHGTLHSTEDPDTIRGMRTIGPVLDIMEQGGGLTLDQCDHIRSQLTPVDRVLEMKRRGKVDPHLLGAAVEMCSPEFADLFSRKKRGKELVILHTDDFTAEFISPLQEAARKSGVPYHTEIMAPTDSITVKTVELLLDRNNRMVLLVISPKALKQWSNLDYEFAIRNRKLLLPILLCPEDGDRMWMDQVLQHRSPVLYSQEHEELQMEGGTVSELELQGIVHDAVFGSIFSPLDEASFRSLLKVWSARTGKQESQGIEKPQDLMRTMATTGYITHGDLIKLEKDMIAAGISFPAIVRDIPVPHESQNQRVTEASVGSEGGDVEIPGFARLAVPPNVLQESTRITVSTVDIASILRGPEGVNWTSGYPWSLGEDACPREKLEQVLFSPAVDINLDGAQLNGPAEIETWRPPGSEGMKCILLKHHDGEGWTDATSSAKFQTHQDRVSTFMRDFSDVVVFWIPLAVLAVGTVKTLVGALSSRTLINSSFAAYGKPYQEKVEVHIVCRDKSIETGKYRPGFARWGQNDAESDVYHGDVMKVAVSIDGGNEKTEYMKLRAVNCKGENGQNVQMLLDRPNGRNSLVYGAVEIVKKAKGERVCQFVFTEEEDASNEVKRTSRKRHLPSSQTSEVQKKKQKESMSWQTDDGAGPSASGARVDVQEYFDDVIEEVSHKWDDLARKLGFQDNEIKVIQDLERDHDRRCREMLHRWRNREGSGATLQVIKQALENIGETRTAESLGDRTYQLVNQFSGLLHDD